MPVTIRSGANQFNHMDITKYSLMLGGLDARHDSIKPDDHRLLEIIYGS